MTPRSGELGEGVRGACGDGGEGRHALGERPAGARRAAALGLRRGLRQTPHVREARHISRARMCARSPGAFSALCGCGLRYFGGETGTSGRRSPGRGTQIGIRRGCSRGGHPQRSRDLRLDQTSRVALLAGGAGRGGAGGGRRRSYNPPCVRAAASEVGAAAGGGSLGTLARAGARYGAMIGAASALNALFQVAAARVLDPPDYSVLATLLTVIAIANVPLLGAQAAVARSVAQRLAVRDEAGAGRILRDGAWFMLKVCAAATVPAVIAALVLVLALNVHNRLPLVAAAATIVVSLFLAIGWGGLQGASSFPALGGIQVVFAALKFALGVGAGAAGLGVAGLLAGVAASAACALGLVAARLRALWQAGATLARRRTSLAGGYTATASLALGAFTALTGVDVLVARASFSPRTAGAYAAASFGVRVLLLVPQTVTTVLFPRVSALGDPVRERRHLLGGVASVAAAGAVGIVLCAVAPHTLLDLTFGRRYGAAAPWLAPLALAMTGHAVGLVYLYHFLAVGRRRVGILFAGALGLQVALYAALHARPYDLVGVQVASALALVVACELTDRSAG